jgi:hypothetical protein
MLCWSAVCISRAAARQAPWDSENRGSWQLLAPGCSYSRTSGLGPGASYLLLPAPRLLLAAPGSARHTFLELRTLSATLPASRLGCSRLGC